MLGGPQGGSPEDRARPIRTRGLPHGPGGILSQDPLLAAPTTVEATPGERVCSWREFPRLVRDQMAVSSRGGGSALEGATGLAHRALGFGVVLARFERPERMHIGQNVHPDAPALCRRSQPAGTARQTVTDHSPWGIDAHRRRAGSHGTHRPADVDSSSRSTIFPTKWPDSRRLRACAYCSNGKTRSITGCSRWDRIKAIICRKSARDPTKTP